MCGLAGLIRVDAAANSRRAAVYSMRARLKHRGPDGEGLWSDACAVLGHTRLALLDAAHGEQPLASPDGRYVLVYNGEIYNHAELRRLLAPGWPFRTRCDTEVVLAAYAAWGEECVQRFNGMFAFLVWDTRERRAFAARDRLGVKPFVYLRQGEEFVFASEAKAILPALHAPPRADLEAVTEYLVAPYFSGVAQPMFAGMSYLPAGHVLTFQDGIVRVTRWAREPEDEDFVAQPGRIPEVLRGHLGEAVRRTLHADVPVGLFFSGGLDSTLIGALARGAGARPKCFTVCFEGQAHYPYKQSVIVTADDRPHAEAAAGLLGLAQDIVAVPRAGLASDLRQLAMHNDALPAWEQELAQHHLARAAATQLKAVMVGDAADETHFGYHFLLDEHATADPMHVLERLTGDPYLRADLLHQPLAHYGAHYRELAARAGQHWRTPSARVRATQWLVRHRWLQRLLHNGDIHSMAHGLEARVPFADTELLEAAARVPAELALGEGREKAMLRAAARGLVPESIRCRRKSALPKDQGNGEWLRRIARRLLIEQHERVAGILDVPRLLRRCEHPAPLDERERAVLFRSAALVHWAQHYEVTLP